MAQKPVQQTVWLHLVPSDIRKDYPNVDDLKRAHGFSVEKMTKSGPTSAVGKVGRVMVKVVLSLDPDIFNQDVITAKLELDEANLVPVFNVDVEVPEPLDYEFEPEDVDS